ncbi:hypothetical protein PROFUN_05857 [Planoprotostelium fungivorum]|uniref:LRR receptor-like serine/threonine-protein kinase n=1 Tax=Planoprotostelium fungivorum TaxID=1890364 RepID=A0A2P6NKT3_9EUKA|nr:hypothetical protein PROFUN_05857 [Planoprotostelium fungivorum]
MSGRVSPKQRTRKYAKSTHVHPNHPFSASLSITQLCGGNIRQCESFQTYRVLLHRLRYSIHLSTKISTDLQYIHLHNEIRRLILFQFCETLKSVAPCGSISNCNPSGSWPTSICLPKWSYKGTLSPSIGNLINLTRLDLSHNNLTGSIPDSIGNLTSLQHLDLSYNNLNGSLPSSIGGLKRLQYLILRHNFLSGSIPATICNLTSLVNLTISANQLTGSIPILMGNMSSLVRLFLAENSLNGTIPSSIGQLPLQTLSLYSNNLAGDVPALPSTLKSLLLNKNSLNGTMSFTRDLMSLVNLDLSNNRFGGSIPSTIGQLKSLSTLALQRNLLYGPIPPSITSLTSLQLLHLYDNRLSGAIPCAMVNLTSLVQIKLQNNQLVTGTNCAVNFMDGLVNLPKLSVLQLNNNQLNGSVSGRSAGTPLQELYLNDNNFTSVGYINVERYCDLSHNLFPCFPLLNVTPTCILDYQPCDIAPLYDNETKISADEAKTAKTISAVILALLRNTSTYDYNSPIASVKLETFDTNSLVGQSVTSDIVNRSVSVVIPVSILGLNAKTNRREIELKGTKELINISMGFIETLPGYEKNNYETEAVCQYWNESSLSWSRDGISLVVDANVTVCQSNHLTNFSIAMQPIAEAPKSTSHTILIIIVVCCVGGGLVLVVILSLVIYSRTHRQRMVGEDVRLIVLDIEGITFDEKIAQRKRGEVWKGTYKGMTSVAVKKFTSSIDVTREMEILKRLHHPNIVQYLGCDARENYIVMEWMTGLSLDNYLSVYSDLSVDTMLVIGRGVTGALSYIASMGMYHNNVVPHKIFITGEKTLDVKLQCLSSIVQQDSPYESQSNELSTAPEILKERRYNDSGHVYSVGVLLWTMVTGNHHLYTTHTNQENIIFTVKEGTDSKLAQAITRCTDTRDKRPSLSELHSTIESREKSLMTFEQTQLDSVYMQ